MLSVRNLSVAFPGRTGTVAAVRNVSLDVPPGAIHGLVGESGAGKTTVGAAILGMIPPPGYRSGGNIRIGDDSLDDLPESEWQPLRGRRISMIFQDPLTSLNPLMTIEQQLVETIRTHSDVDRGTAREKAESLLSETGINNAAQRMKEYPHQFSGGMRQRVVIALALSTDPEVIIADEPTTALDVAVQDQVLSILLQTVAERKIAAILITHDMGVIAKVAQTVTVLRHGRVVEAGPTAEVLGSPREEYTQSLLASVPRVKTRLNRFPVPDVRGTASSDGNFARKWLLSREDSSPDRDQTALDLVRLRVTFGTGRRLLGRKAPRFVALDDVSLRVAAGSILGLVGESGSGKSTLAKVVAGLQEPDHGSMYLFEQELPSARRRSRRHPSRRQVQMVFQDPYSSLNNRRTIGAILRDPLEIFGFESDRARRDRLIGSVLELVGLSPDAAGRYPHQFSGGERQRVAVARALLCRPRFLICDEPTSSLDVSIQAQVLNLLRDLQQEFALSMIFISHDLSVIRQMADTIVVLKDGRVVETATNDSFFSGPTNEYSQQLLELTPTIG